MRRDVANDEDEDPSSQDEGILVSCGRSGDHQLGFVTNEPIQWKFRPIRTLSRIVQVSAGDSHNLALDALGHVYVWGSGKHGRLGLGDELFRATPIKIEPCAFSPDARIVQVSAGSEHSACVSANGRLFTWGNNAYGQLGLNADQAFVLAPRLLTPSLPASTGATTGRSSTNENNLSKRKAKAVAENIFQSFSVVSCGCKHTLVLLENGTVMGCGSNAFGELGITGQRLEANWKLMAMDETFPDENDARVEETDKKAQQVFIPDQSDDEGDRKMRRGRHSKSMGRRVVGIAAGSDCSVVWKASGAAFTFGLGHSRPQKMHFKDEFHVQVVKCCLARDTLLVLAQDGRVFSRDRRGAGVVVPSSSPSSSPRSSSRSLAQSGSPDLASSLGQPSQRLKPSSSFRSGGAYWTNAKRMETLEDIVDISCSSNHCAAIDDEGRILTWGQDEALGQGYPAKKPKPSSTLFKPVPVIVGAKQISCGKHHTIALIGFDRPEDDEAEAEEETMFQFESGSLSSSDKSASHATRQRAGRAKGVGLLSSIVESKLAQTMDCFNFHRCFEVVQELHLPVLGAAVERFVFANFDMLNYLNPNAMRLFEFSEDEEEDDNDDDEFIDDVIAAQMDEGDLDQERSLEYEPSSSLGTSMQQSDPLFPADQTEGEVEVNRSTEQPSLETIVGTLSCALCKMHFRSTESMGVHLAGKKHRRATEQRHHAAGQPSIGATPGSFIRESQRERKLKMREDRRRQAQQQRQQRQQGAVGQKKQPRMRWKSPEQLAKEEDEKKKQPGLREILKQQEKEARARSLSLEKVHSTLASTPQKEESLPSRSSWAARAPQSTSKIPKGVELGNEAIAIIGTSKSRRQQQHADPQPPKATKKTNDVPIAVVQASPPARNFRDIMKTEDEMAKKEAAKRASRPLSQSAWGFIPRGPPQ